MRRASSSSASASRSDGEIVEDSGKATASLPSAQDPFVDRPSRLQTSADAPLSRPTGRDNGPRLPSSHVQMSPQRPGARRPRSSTRSPSPYRASRQHRAYSRSVSSSSRSRSPRRDHARKSRNDDDYPSSNRGGRDAAYATHSRYPRSPRHGGGGGERRRDRGHRRRRRDRREAAGRRDGYHDLDQEGGSYADLRYDEHRHRDKRIRTASRSRSPPKVRDAGRLSTDREPNAPRGHENGSSEHHSPREQTGEFNKEELNAHHESGCSDEKATSLQDSDIDMQQDEPALAQSQMSTTDELTEIEQRRKRREAIRAKHRITNDSLLVQAVSNNATDQSAAQRPSETSHTTPALPTPSLDSVKSSPPQTPQETSGDASPTALDLTQDAATAASWSGAVNNRGPDDEPSAADYDPTADMEEDQKRHGLHQVEELAAGAYDETKQPAPQILMPTEHDHSHQKQRDEFDMFADDDEADDMFADGSDAQPSANGTGGAAKAVSMNPSKAIDMSMLDDWDDDEGYYKVIIGELLDDRYHVQLNLGKGMFSGVVRALDSRSQNLVAIKIIRSNETMRKAAQKEIEILDKLTAADPEDKKHVVRLERSFEHKGHLCMVFENLSINLREVLKKFGRDVGINLKAVRAYAQQMFLALSLLRRCNILHADVKPDNMLVNESRNMLKVCDLGSASDASENEITPYLVSRFYRAPEIILGLPYDFGIDMWSVGCTLYELYTGKILFTGRTNNQMLRAIMDCRGKFNHKLLRKAQFAPLHFDDLLNFRSVERDNLSGKDLVRVLNFAKPTRDLRTRILGNTRGRTEAEVKELQHFVDLLDKCLNLNPEKRLTPSEALRHSFILRK